MKKLLPLIIIILFSFVFYLSFSQATKSAKIKRVECQNSTTTFERIFVEKPVKDGIEALLSNNYILKSNIEYSKLMESNLKDKLYIEDLDKQVINAIDKYKTSENKSDKKVYINYYLYENDKKDTKKTNEDSKKYPGYLLFDFNYDGKLIYKIQIDYVNLDGSDLNERIDCAINSFISIKGN